MSKNDCGLKIHGTATIGKKGQIVIPKSIRQLIGLEEGDTLVVMTKNDSAIGLIKNDDLPKIMKYMKEEMEETTQ